MKFIYLMLPILVSLSGCNQSDSDNNIEVYISTGELQCQDNGLSISLTKSYLQEAGIEVKDESCGNLILVDYPSVCGGGTGKLHVFTIHENHSQTAENIGFTIPDSTVGGGDYAKVECSD
ncbi:MULTISPECIES: hypothetical protein [unclassified Colwellia]|uniref:hypothetical protein n=1 Tax=unclassified Colwellia TaxID=196834 RepID=UPI0015F4905D|nr:MULTISPECIES: hypothetical protein [unclassified Colwellia]MBA6358071.1 hypothetical protein [Colwellia sp. BRX8-3]MBA6361968.1 hypothetical protein [Colwellia sp. BRX8-6]MBA6369739.1 hypothetical protein [Colwellia sp. BRX8-5]MBA6377387.1 hypothetical protein [Colwellia sp. BRX8-2]MBA6381248.1 hypothetical protein [Colwellia sp. BRX10-7]|tara:strand:- start:4809 stop:5168 length:360 start_codon:yes stop_codon:yes gene_type:complete